MILTQRLTRPLLCLILLGSTTLALQGCVPLILGGAAAATAGVVITDRRSAEQQGDDKLIELKVNHEMRSRYNDGARINTSAYNGVVLLSGELLNQENKTQATEVASKISKVKSVSNQIAIVDAISPFSVVTNDTWITSKVMTSLTTTKGVPSRTIVVTTDRSVVYLMGMVTQHEGDLAAATAAQVSGVRRVEKLFQIVSPAEANQLDSGAGVTSNTSSTQSAPMVENAVQTVPVSSGEVQALPIQ